MRAPESRRRGFSLVELLMVILIMGVAMSLISVFGQGGKRDRRALMVRQSAEQLASVLRQARAMAMDRKSNYGVSFNITNGPGTSGRILNNHGGGHWYRIIGPVQNNAALDLWQFHDSYNAIYKPVRVKPDSNFYSVCDLPWGKVLDEYDADWASERFALPKGEVRFLALTDQDNGNLKNKYWKFGPTYPRPWFGEWDRVTGKMHAWGGYEPDPTMLEFVQTQGCDVGRSYFYLPRSGPSGTISYTGFYYEGTDGRISGCVNPRDRFIYEDVDRDGWIDPAKDTKTLPLFKKGQPRPLVNGDWLDSVIEFHPDGTAAYDEWFRNRHEYTRGYGLFRNPPNDFSMWPGPSPSMWDLGPGDLCNQFEWYVNKFTPFNTKHEASNYDEWTGTYYITLAPDTLDDRSVFDTAEQALATLMPMFRVAINRSGEVKVIEVKRQPTSPGLALDDVHKGTWWEAPRQTHLEGFNNNLMHAPDGSKIMPVEDFVTAGMLEHRQWWIAP